jgi:hypothetical protein
MEFTITDKGEYLLFSCTGMLGFEKLSKLIDGMRAESERTGKKRIVADLREVQGVFDTLSRYRVGVLVAERLPGRRILSLARPEQITRVAENTAVNRGADLFTTDDETRGMAWLLG